MRAGRRHMLATLLGFALSAGAVAPVPGAGLRDLGPAPDRTRVRIAVVLRYRNPADLERLVRLQADPESPLYHRFLKPAEFAAAFAPAPADYTRVTGSLRRAGFTVTQIFANRTIVDATAPVRIAERYFGTSIDALEQPGAGVRYAN